MSHLAVAVDLTYSGAAPAMAGFDSVCQMSQHAAVTPVLFCEQRGKVLEKCLMEKSARLDRKPEEENRLMLISGIL